MPQFFHFEFKDAQHPEDDLRFDGQLHSHQCTFIKTDGARCRRRCVIGLPCCFSHIGPKYKLKIAPSTIPGAGKGLFAYDRTKGPDDIVFKGPRPSRYAINKTGDKICPYHGEAITPEQAQERYGDHTAPYAVLVNQRKIEDAALERGAGSLINAKPRVSANCEFVHSRDGQSMSIFARKNIRNNQELFLNYGAAYELHEHGVRISTNTSKYRL